MEKQPLAGLLRVPGVTAAFLVDANGVPAASGGRSTRGTLSEAQAALLSATVGALRQAAADLQLGDLGETIIEADRGSIVAGTLPGGRAAVVLADGRANLGMIRVELRRLRRGA